MKKGLIKSLILMIFLSSCSGLLWDVREGGDLTLSISNPFYQPGRSASSRALALQGQYIYIELALINDQAAYDADSAKAVTGNGTWVETAWGGHAIVTLSLDLSTLDETIEATFVDVPRDQELNARAFLEENETIFTAGIQGGYNTDMDYDEILDYAICQTFIPAGGTYAEAQWIPVSTDELNDNFLVLPIRPYDFTNNQLYSVDTGEVSSNTASYIDSSTPFLEVSEPEPGKTAFNAFDAYLEYDYLRDIALFVAVEASFTVPTILPGYVMMYDELGNPVDTIFGDAFPGNLVTEYRSFMIGYPDVDDSYVMSEYFIGSTVFPTAVEMSWTYFPSGSYDVSYGLLIDISPEAQHTTNSPYNLVINWNPVSGLEVDELEFKILHLVGSSSLIGSDIDTISKINALSPTLVSDWATYTALTYTDSNIGASDSVNDWVIILGRASSNSQSFIYARTQIWDNSI
ncbi:hypothetical protein [Spirochaeta isovalerica]|uniref:Uncharacterized protein n=1 Tax=Spirochaeta isovalerica TaxID=150 RepID=A0A841R7B3_9SPIO|nr:hypothetical protein [Spirochaeta isovalerica]MBB6479735.1 hypothetical protein [Spirochaeta isovalerica]